MSFSGLIRHKPNNVTMFSSSFVGHTHHAVGQFGLVGVEVAAKERSVVSQKLAPRTMKVVAHQTDEVHVPRHTMQGKLLFAPDC